MDKTVKLFDVYMDLVMTVALS